MAGQRDDISTNVPGTVVVVIGSKCSDARDIKSKKQCANGCGCIDV